MAEVLRSKTSRRCVMVGAAALRCDPALPASQGPAAAGPAVPAVMIAARFFYALHPQLAHVRVHAMAPTLSAALRSWLR